LLRMTGTYSLSSTWVVKASVPLRSHQQMRQVIGVLRGTSASEKL